MSFLTSCCDLPQNEQYSVLVESPPLSFVINQIPSFDSAHPSRLRGTLNALPPSSGTAT